MMNNSLNRKAAFVVEGKKGYLVGREEGKVVAGRVLKSLEAIETESILPINFGKMDLVDASAADELLTTIIRRISTGELENRFIVLEKMGTVVEDNIQAALKARRLVCPKVDDKGEAGIVGEIGPELLETYKLAVHKREISANDVRAIAPKILISAISNRLSKLQQMGLIMRTKKIGGEKGGQLYLYQPVM